MTESTRVEIDLWTDKIERFRNEFSSMNDVKFQNSEIINKQGQDTRYVLFYRNYGSKLRFPPEGYYQLKHVWETPRKKRTKQTKLPIKMSVKRKSKPKSKKTRQKLIIERY